VVTDGEVPDSWGVVLSKCCQGFAIGTELDIPYTSFMAFELGEFFAAEVPDSCGAVISTRRQGFAIGTELDIPDTSLMAFELIFCELP
jgi:hypothetical protein